MQFLHLASGLEKYVYSTVHRFMLCTIKKIEKNIKMVQNSDYSKFPFRTRQP